MGTYINNLKNMLGNLKLDIITGMSNFTGYTYGTDDMTLGTMNAFMGATDDTFGGYTNLLNDGSVLNLLYYDKSQNQKSLKFSNTSNTLNPGKVYKLKISLTAYLLSSGRYFVNVSLLGSNNKVIHTADQTITFNKNDNSSGSLTATSFSVVSPVEGDDITGINVSVQYDGFNYSSLLITATHVDVATSSYPVKNYTKISDFMVDFAKNFNKRYPTSAIENLTLTRMSRYINDPKNTDTDIIAKGHMKGKSPDSKALNLSGANSQLLYFDQSYTAQGSKYSPVFYLSGYVLDIKDNDELAFRGYKHRDVVIYVSSLGNSNATNTKLVFTNVDGKTQSFDVHWGYNSCLLDADMFENPNKVSIGMSSPATFHSIQIDLSKCYMTLYN